MSTPKTALLWDESFLWGLMALKSLRGMGAEPELVSAAAVADGALEGYEILFVPGGWASDKAAALGEAGKDAVRQFVRRGGSYLGFCGGAGLALDVEGGLSLTHVGRVPTIHRVPSFSGEVELAPLERAHPLWRGIAPPYVFHAWWPGQFHIAAEAADVRVLARYAAPGKDFSLADLTSSDVCSYDDGWVKWEEDYGINLDPARLMGEPAIIECGYGDGRALLSYPHLETPECRKGNRALVNALEYLKPQKRLTGRKKRSGRRKSYAVSREAAGASREMLTAAKEFIEFGSRNFLWYWRNGWVLQWRRGVRGVEYSMLYGLVSEIAGGLRRLDRTPDPDFSEKVVSLKERLLPFFEDAKTLLMRERYAMMHGGMSALKSHDPAVEKLRDRLFSSSKRFGGEFKKILDMLDELVRATLG